MFSIKLLPMVTHVDKVFKCNFEKFRKTCSRDPTSLQDLFLYIFGVKVHIDVVISTHTLGIRMKHSLCINL